MYGISLFLPTIVNNLGYTSSTAQLLTVPIYVTASIPVIFFLCLMVVGFAMCIAADPDKKPGVVYAGVFLIACAIYPSFPGNVTWLSNNLAGSYKRSAGMAIQIGVGNHGGVSSDHRQTGRQIALSLFYFCSRRPELTLTTM